MVTWGWRALHLLHLDVAAKLDTRKSSFLHLDALQIDLGAMSAAAMLAADGHAQAK
jgi:hypothetical protein